MSGVDGVEGIAKPKLRTRLWAILISLFVPGLGQAFLGYYRRGAVFTIVIVSVLLIFKFSSLLGTAWPRAAFPMILFVAAAGTAIVIGAAVDSWRLGRETAVPRLGRARRYLVYLALILAWFAAEAFDRVAPQWRAFSVPSASMMPALQPGDYFFVLDGYFKSHAPQRGDLVVFTLPCQYPQLDPPTAQIFTARCNNTTEFVKRVMGLPGDRIQMKRGILYVNDQPAKRERLQSFRYTDEGRVSNYAQYIETLPDGHSDTILEIDDNQPLDNTDGLTVPADSYFMIGDNRDDSADSRDPTSGIGFVPRDRLVGKAAFIYFSIDRQSTSGRNTSLFPSFHWNRIGMPLS
jgi:signal peptidase I